VSSTAGGLGLEADPAEAITSPTLTADGLAVAAASEATGVVTIETVGAGTGVEEAALAGGTGAGPLGETGEVEVGAGTDGIEEHHCLFLQKRCGLTIFVVLFSGAKEI